MHRYLRFFILMLTTMIFIQTNAVTAQPQIIILTWENVVGRSLHDNIGLQIMNQDYRSQKLSEWNALSNFMPTINYQGMMVNNLELPVFVFMGEKIQVGTDYNFQHTLQLSLPVFNGGLRWANWKAQRILKKSLNEELSAATDATVLNGLQAYFGIILANSMTAVTQEAVDAAKANMDDVQQFFNEGAASNLDLQRAKAQYFSTLPQLESARNRKKITANQLKYILNISISDSLVISDSLSQMNFLKEYESKSLAELTEFAYQNRPEIKSIGYQAEAVNQQKNIIRSKFLPTLALSADVTHQAQINTSNIAKEDYIRVKTVGISLQLPLFEGGKRAIEFQQAQLENNKMQLMKKQVYEQINMETEQSYYSYQEAIKNLRSLKQTMVQAHESLRLSNLMYKEGMSTQVEVLNAQLFYTQSNVNYQEGVYNFNVSQLALLKSIGKIKTIWEVNR